MRGICAFRTDGTVLTATSTEANMSSLIKGILNIDTLRTHLQCSSYTLTTNAPNTAKHETPPQV